MSFNPLIGRNRSSNLVDGKMQKRIESKDGTRWAYSRAYTVYFRDNKNNRCFKPVTAWVLKERCWGKAMTVRTQMDEKTARKWVKEGKL